MVITYHGGNYVKIQSGGFTALVDPTDQRSFKGAQLVLHTVLPPVLEAGKANGELLEMREPLWIDHAGEYEVSGVEVRGIPMGEEGGRAHTAYRVTLDNITIGILGFLMREPEVKALAELADLDILFVPGGGKPLITQSTAAKIVRQLEPGIIVPTLAKDLGPFLKELGHGKCPAEEKLTVKKKDIVPKAMAVHCLSI
ncbi:MAG: MBL fold metallo-hydrolase [Candidatus Jorgensenbacteria bacterium]